MSRHCRHVRINGVTLANGVNLAGRYGGGSLSSQGPQYKITGSGTTGLAPNPSTGQGGSITFDCDYSPSSDAVRWSPSLRSPGPVFVSNVSGIKLNKAVIAGTTYNTSLTAPAT
ncbi:hypothetical protein [Paraburkholderia youngii]|uniref:hypothetical protein n=1 Tax=Paraburkholderia youngii TaxID=2782701 RepID=UPI003D20C0B4